MRTDVFLSIGRGSPWGHEIGRVRQGGLRGRSGLAALLPSGKSGNNRCRTRPERTLKCRFGGDLGKQLNELNGGPAPSAQRPTSLAGGRSTQTLERLPQQQESSSSSILGPTGGVARWGPQFHTFPLRCPFCPFCPFWPLGPWQFAHHPPRWPTPPFVPTHAMEASRRTSGLDTRNERQRAWEDLHTVYSPVVSARGKQVKSSWAAGQLASQSFGPSDWDGPAWRARQGQPSRGSPFFPPSAALAMMAWFLGPRLPRVG